MGHFSSLTLARFSSVPDELQHVTSGLFTGFSNWYICIVLAWEIYLECSFAFQ